jgi:hypothetical protein
MPKPKLGPLPADFLRKAWGTKAETKPKPQGSIMNCGDRRWGWQVRIPLGRGSKPHYKTVGPARKDAQAYIDWYVGLVAAGNAPPGNRLTDGVEGPGRAGMQVGETI